LFRKINTFLQKTSSKTIIVDSSDQQSNKKHYVNSQGYNSERLPRHVLGPITQESKYSNGNLRTIEKYAQHACSSQASNNCSISSSRNDGVSSLAASHQIQQQTSKAAQQRKTFVVMCILLVFLNVLSLPGIIVLASQGLVQTFTMTRGVKFPVFSIVALNSIINPFLYTVKLPEFRAAIKTLVKAVYDRILCKCPARSRSHTITARTIYITVDKIALLFLIYLIIVLLSFMYLIQIMSLLYFVYIYVILAYSYCVGGQIIVILLNRVYNLCTLYVLKGEDRRLERGCAHINRFKPTVVTYCY